jgi:hypothetical protein
MHEKILKMRVSPEKAEICHNDDTFRSKSCTFCLNFNQMVNRFYSFLYN